MRVTIDDVAREAGVSRATVSRFLNGTARVADATADRVTAAVRRLGYMPNSMAQQLARGASDLVGLLIRDPRNRAYGLLHLKVQEACEARGLRLVTVVPGGARGSEFEFAGLETLVGLRAGGLLVATGVLPSESLARMAEQLPIVSVGRPESHPRIFGVSYDENRNATILADQVLTYGHRGVAVVSAAYDVSVPECVRGRGMAERLRERGAQVYHFEAPTFGVTGERHSEVLELVRARKATAVMFSTDLRAVSFLDVAAASGVKVPEDCSVTGCDGIMTGLGLLGLATLRIPTENVALRSVEVMASILAGEEVPVRHEKFVGTLVSGRSLAAPR